MSKCGCHIKADPVEIIYCPLHKAAPEMYEALKALQADIKNGRHTEVTPSAQYNIDTSLASAEGK